MPLTWLPSCIRTVRILWILLLIMKEWMKITYLKIKGYDECMNVACKVCKGGSKKIHITIFYFYQFYIRLFFINNISISGKKSSEKRWDGCTDRNVKRKYIWCDWMRHSSVFKTIVLKGRGMQKVVSHCCVLANLRNAVTGRKSY